MSERRAVYTRWRAGEDRVRRIYDPLPTREGEDGPCPACGCLLYASGQRLALFAVGPGGDPEALERHLAGRWYSAEALLFHVTCLGVQ